MIQCIDHPALASRDVRRLAQWYCQHLCLSVIADNGKTPPSLLLGFAQGVGSGNMIEIMPAIDPGPDPADVPRFAPGLRHLALRVADFDATYLRLKEAGVRFYFEPVPALGGGRVVSFADPEGNELQIVERKA